MADSQSAASSGIGLGGALFITFLVLKLTHVISWSWLWVTAPLWGGLAIFFAVLLCFGGFVLAMMAIDAIGSLRRK